MYAEKAYQDKLQRELQQHFGRPAAHGEGRRDRGKSVAAERSREQRSARRAPRKRSRTTRSCASWCATSAPRWYRLQSARPTTRPGHRTRGDAMMKGGLGNLMKQAQQMQENMKRRRKSSSHRGRGQSGAGLVKVTITCTFA
jgi:hypothetical protein